MRFREWYGYHFPELVKIVPDNYTYARVVHLMKNRKEFTNDREEELEAITMDSGKTAAIFEAMKTTIGELASCARNSVEGSWIVSILGMDISPIDLINIESFANRVIHLFEYRKGLQEVGENDEYCDQHHDVVYQFSIFEVKWVK